MPTANLTVTLDDTPDDFAVTFSHTPAQRGGHWQEEIGEAVNIDSIMSGDAEIFDLLDEHELDAFYDALHKHLGWKA